MHLGAATKTTTLGLFKVTDPAVYAPYGGGDAAIHVNDRPPEVVAREIARVFESRHGSLARCEERASLG
jgi:ADP-heptose:LPS heptosyltransferase